MQRQIWIFSRCIEDCRQECKKPSVDNYLTYPTDLLKATIVAKECGFSRRGGSYNINEDDLLKIGAALTQQGIKVVKLLSNGGFGQVVSVMQRGINDVLKISLDPISDTQQGRKDCSLLREVEIISRLNEESRHLTVFEHPIIPQLQHCFHEVLSPLALRNLQQFWAWISVMVIVGMSSIVFRKRLRSVVP